MGGLELALLCLALNVYFESRGESYEGQLAVAHVTLNRSRAKQRSVCEEVYSPYQFSWTSQITFPPEPSEQAWIDAQNVSRLAYQTNDPTGGALWYHRYDITPWWVWNKVVVRRIDKHVFYKCKPKHYCEWR